MIRTFALAAVFALTGSAIAAPGTPIQLSDVVEPIRLPAERPGQCRCGRGIGAADGGHS